MFNKVTVDINEVAKGMEEPAPSLIILGQLKDAKEVLLLVEGKLVTKIELIKAPIILLGAFYCFGMSYPKGLQNLYTFFECILLDQKPLKMSNNLMSKELTFTIKVSIKSNCCYLLFPSQSD